MQFNAISKRSVMIAKNAIFSKNPEYAEKLACYLRG
jgi:hypothetical protein